MTLNTQHNAPARDPTVRVLVVPFFLFLSAACPFFLSFFSLLSGAPEPVVKYR